MMKKLAIIFLSLISGYAVSATPITVYGYGTDRESAKKDAFRTAIENVCGIKIISKREQFNNNIFYNDIATHSTCRIISHYIIKEENDPYRIQIQVQVENTKHTDRLNAESNGFQFNNDLADNIQGYYDEKKSGDKLLDTMFRDYPYNAFNLKQNGKPYITDDNFRNLYLMIPYKLNWNYSFIESMLDTFSHLDTRYGDARVTVIAKNPKAILLGRRDNFHFSDYERLEYIKSKFVGDNELRILIKARDNKGKNILNICYSPEYKQGGIFFSVGVYKEMTIFGNDINEGLIQIRLNFPAEVIYDLSVDIAAERDCKLYNSPL